MKKRSRIKIYLNQHEAKLNNERIEKAQEYENK